MRMRRGAGAAISIAMAMGLLVACGDDGPGAGGGGGDTKTVAEIDEPVTIKVSNLPPETEASVRDAFEKRVEEFEDANPNITVEPQEW